VQEVVHEVEVEEEGEKGMEIPNGNVIFFK